LNVFKQESDFNILDWWKKALIENYANFEGRARRTEYWYFVLFKVLLVLIIYPTGIALVGIDENGSALNFPILVFIVGYLAMLIPSLAVSVRRLHDTGKSGWFYLLNIIPLGGLVLFIFYLQDSDPGNNEWGPNPKELYTDEIY